MTSAAIAHDLYSVGQRITTPTVVVLTEISTFKAIILCSENLRYTMSNAVARF